MEFQNICNEMVAPFLRHPVHTTNHFKPQVSANNNLFVPVNQADQVDRVVRQCRWLQRHRAVPGRVIIIIVIISTITFTTVTERLLYYAQT